MERRGRLTISGYTAVQRGGVVCQPFALLYPESLRARLNTFLLVVVAALAAPSTAAAHLHTGMLAVDYRATVVSAPKAIKTRIYTSDRAVALTLASGHVLVVRGYLGEPFARLDRAGTSVNAASLTAVGLGLVPTSRRHGWVQYSRSHTFVWHDERLRGLPAHVDEGRWTIPLVVDGNPTHISGTLSRVPPPSPWKWALLAIALALPAGLMRARPFGFRARHLAVLFGLISALSMLVALVGFAFNTYASAGRRFEDIAEFGFTAVAIAAIIFGSPQVRALAAGVLGLLALVVGLSEFQVFRHGLVLSPLPGTIVRLAVVTSISAGAVAATLGFLMLDKPAVSGDV